MAYTQSNEIKTRISLKYDTLANWTTANPLLLAGEVAIAVIETADPATKQHPPVMFKVGPGNFNSLEWASALAADVYGWAKESSINVTKNGTGNVVASISWDATLNGGKGGIKYETASVATSEGLDEVQRALAGLTETVNGMYTNAQIDAAIKVVADDLDEHEKAFEAFKTTNTQAIADAKAGAEATAAGALSAARIEITAEIDADVKALADGAVAAAQGRADDAYELADAAVTPGELTTALNPYAKTADVPGIKVNNAGTADKVANALTVGNKSFDGSAAVEVTAADLGLESAMHFVGVLEAAPSTATAGDVYLNSTNNKEYIYDTVKGWVELGDEGSYALRTITVTGNDGLTGGGDLTANRTISIAASGVTTAKIADKNVTKAKLADDVQTSLGLADSAIQAADLGDAAYKGVAANMMSSENDKLVTVKQVNDEITTRINANNSTLNDNIAKKADKVIGATAGNLAGLDANGNLTDSGKKASDFATAAQGTKADDAAAAIATYGDIVTHNIAEFATAAQGTKADQAASAIATHGDIVTHNVAEFATAAQGAKADSAIQRVDLGDAAFKGVSTDMTVGNDLPTVTAVTTHVNNAITAYNTNTLQPELAKLPTTYKQLQTAVAEKGAANKTLKISQNAQGVISTEAVDIAITASQVTNFDDAVAEKVNTMGLGTNDTIVALDERVTAAEGDITNLKTAVNTTLPGEIAKKVDQNAYDQKIAALERADSDEAIARGAVADRVTALETNSATKTELTNGLAGKVDLSAYNTKMEALDQKNGELTTAVQNAQGDATYAKTKVDTFFGILSDDTADIVDTLAEINKNITDNTGAFTGLSNRVTNIENGTTVVPKATDANTLDGHDSTYFAVAADLGEAAERGVATSISLTDTVNLPTASAVCSYVEGVNLSLSGKIDTKANRVTGATAGNLAGLDANGNLTDSGKKASDFATAAQGAKADSAVQTVATGSANGTIAVDGANVAVKGLGDAAYRGVATEIKPENTDKLVTQTVASTLAANAAAAAVAGLDSTASAVGNNAAISGFLVVDGKVTTVVSKEYADVAVSGNIADLVQTADTYVLFNCGSATTVI